MIIRIFERYEHKKGMITTDFPSCGHIESTLNELGREITDKQKEEIIGALNRDLLYYLEKWIVKEFENSTGTLTLSEKEFQDYFRLDDDLTTKLKDILFGFVYLSISAWFLKRVEKYAKQNGLHLL